MDIFFSSSKPNMYPIIALLADVHSIQFQIRANMQVGIRQNLERLLRVINYRPIRPDDLSVLDKLFPNLIWG